MDEPHPDTRRQPLVDALRRRLRQLYFGGDASAVQFQIAMLLIDVAVILFFLAGPYLRKGPSYVVIDFAVAAVIAFELAARALIAPNLRYWLTRPLTWVDFIILATLLFPNQLSNFAFLRVLRIWAISQSKLVTLFLRRRGYQAYEDVIQACVNFVVFLFVVTGFVYSNFFYADEGAAGFVDALYFTVATVTTTGFGDITLPGTLGKLTSIVTMIIGISLFVRLAQAIVRPYKVTYSCPECGLGRHDADAVHCKACGHILNIPDEGS
ncbi:potassium channel family protein [Sinorhizobium sp. BG8]|uniref:potassium channel family protein n=1 Tax=Sinorhizobium sp. BG8 TaxID=2613773 RepID=UPI00193DF8C7|nr:potassium channel family protein [Sinorhizobium sp. BG8]QRM56801.1 two pore domain potassium channel family protein [Sinorhizobium sp. BG8]